jgi:chitinase
VTRLAAVSAILALCAIGAAGVTIATGAEPEHQTPAPYVVVAYFGAWDPRHGYNVKQIPATAITHLNYAFAEPSAGGRCALGRPQADYERPLVRPENAVDGVADVNAAGAPVPGQRLFGNFNQLRKLKAMNPQLKVLISIGGASVSSSRLFSDVAATAAARAKFVASCLDLFITGNLPPGRRLAQAGGPGSAAGLFDGIDIDWEFPGIGPHARAGDRHNATLLLQRFRRQLDALGQQLHKRYLLTAALPAGDLSSRPWELSQVAASLDWINVMSYDFHGPWDSRTNFNSPFALSSRDPTRSGRRLHESTTGTISLYRSLGVPAGKLVVGVPFYARQYVRVRAANGGLYQPFDNRGLTAADVVDWRKSVAPSYHQLVDIAGIAGSGARPGVRGFTSHWDPGAGEPWLYARPARQLGRRSGGFISYDDPRSLAERVGLIRSQHLRGAMIWEIGQDDNAHDLVRVFQPLLGTG